MRLFLCVFSLTPRGTLFQSMLQSQAPLAKLSSSPPPWGDMVNFWPSMESIRGTVHTVLTEVGWGPCIQNTWGGGGCGGDGHAGQRQADTDSSAGESPETRGGWRGGDGDTNRTGMSVSMLSTLCSGSTGKAAWCVFSGPSPCGSVGLSSTADSSPTLPEPARPHLRPAGAPCCTHYHLYSQ